MGGKHISREADESVVGMLDHWSPTYRALGYQFSVGTNVSGVVDYLRPIFQPFETRLVPDTVYRFVALDDAKGPTYVLYVDGQGLDTHRNPAAALSTLFWHVNRQVIAHSQDYLLIHAAAVADGGDALVFPAPEESGKTTLAAGLVRSGLQYLTDEVVAIDLSTGLVEPFPRALSVDRGSWQALADVRPHTTTRTRPFVGKQWQLPPRSIRADAIGARARPSLIILPHYRQGKPTELTPLGRADAVRVMAEQSFNLRVHGGGAVALLAELARGAECYRLGISDLDEACELVRAAFDNRRGGARSPVRP